MSSDFRPSLSIVRPLGGRWVDRLPTVVVSGLPRSGTSMMMQMLTAGGVSALTDGIRRADEDNPRGYYELEAVKRTKDDASWLNEAEGKAVKIIYALITDLPTDRPYRVIMMRRKTEKVMQSQADMLARLGESGSQLSPDELAATYERQLHQVMSYMERHDCFEFIEVWYGAILAFPRTQVERIDRFLSGRLDVEAMVAAIDPSLQRK
jgi:hypothetical protein